MYSNGQRRLTVGENQIGCPHRMTTQRRKKRTRQDTGQQNKKSSSFVGPALALAGWRWLDV
ncbi:unnamed protein product [Acanthoscelides obtectus]|uniref:Uncharacterized protein n=1 Tax=Acanthoscelides obtectus TaxID=200917 RepID=A0A9P0LE41_ACAOB|nr:unnamed protein product [Acanthoscelides obtectus]CAK1670666.1 hypothetical protein AOBTE_LOCUS27745 [Acanthoscelides obtectus]